MSQDTELPSSSLELGLLPLHLTLSPSPWILLNSRYAEAPRAQVRGLKTKSWLTEAEDSRRCLGIASPTTASIAHSGALVPLR